MLLVTILLPFMSACPGVSTNEVHLDCVEESKVSHKDQQKSTTPVIEYYKEHEVSEKEARVALHALDFDKVARVPAWCDECGIEKINFCHSTTFINDHCCCEHRHAREKLPWIPHTCYLGKERCQPHTSSCTKYREIRECCCDRLLITEYKAKFSTGARAYSQVLLASCIMSVISSTISGIHFS